MVRGVKNCQIWQQSNFVAMVDNVKLYLPRCRDMPSVTPYLDSGSERTDIDTGEVSVYGSVSNIRVSQTFGGYYIQGSLPKYLYGNNVCQLTRKDIGTAIENLSDTLHLPIQDADVTSIEVGANICLSKVPSAYIGLLGDMPRMKRVMLGDSLYYRGSGKVFPRQYYFYDKKQEVKKKGGVMPVRLETANMLRYEMRLYRRLAKQLGIQELKASTLQDRAVYRELVNRWLDGYLSINKITGMKEGGLKGVSGLKEAKELFLARLIARSGGTSVIEEFINYLKTGSGMIGKRDVISKTKRELYRLAMLKKGSVDDGLINELTDNVKMIAQDG